MMHAHTHVNHGDRRSQRGEGGQRTVEQIITEHSPSLMQGLTINMQEMPRIHDRMNILLLLALPCESVGQLCRAQPKDTGGMNQSQMKK